MAKCHSSGVMALYHLEMASFNIDRAAAHGVSLNLSTSPFCHSALT
jgi:hypothetical protein